MIKTLIWGIAIVVSLQKFFYSAGFDGVRKAHQPYIVIICGIRHNLHLQTITEIKHRYISGQKYGSFPDFFRLLADASS